MANEHVKIIDCTLRDGGIMNNWEFSVETVKKMYTANLQAGIDIMEMGYRVSPKYFHRDEHGPWRFCDESDIRKITGNRKSDLKIAVMGDIGRVTMDDFIPKTESVIDIFRLACYVHQIDEAIDFSNHLNNLGYETIFNIMAVSTQPAEIICECLGKVNSTGATAVYLSDTFGSMYPYETTASASMYRELCPNLALGFHGHNNIQLALANSMAALESGVDYIDGTYYGMGRGAGNTPLELLLSVIRDREYNLTPIMKVIQTDIEPLMEKYQWGYRIPYAVSGMLNQHPGDALKLMKETDKSCYGRFYEKSLNEADNSRQKLSGMIV
ncbi:MAG: aldolase catalytic domain-containing protein [Spirochaetales bacterium]|nr:aldolase catalytic domain-containing protein [Spirochaetales bacterium]